MAVEAPRLEEQARSLRAELKLWERQFSVANNGRKADRHDIKNATEIESKYRQYNRIRDALSGKMPSPIQASPACISERVQRPAAHPEETKVGADPPPTPSKHDGRLESAAEEAPTSSNSLHTPAATRVYLGPTPQKDGTVFGLFDLPSGGKGTIFLDSPVRESVQATPSKLHVPADGSLSPVGRARGIRTPRAHRRHFLVDAYTTPSLKRKRNLELTPSSGKRLFQTPTFLHRYNKRLTCDKEEEDEGGEQEARTPSKELWPTWKRRGFGRSLSGMIADLRKQEDDALDEELEIMRDMELEHEQQAHGLRHKSAPEVLVEDSQNISPDLDGVGRASPGETESPVRTDGVDLDAKPRKPWKKKGQKRQTRRVVMRPVRAKQMLQPALAPALDEQDENQAVSEPRTLSRPKTIAAPGDRNLSGSHEDSEYEDEVPSPPREPSRVSRADKASDTHEVGKSEKEKRPRKIDPNKQSHANFVRLKIKSKNAKSNSGRGRFGRGRR